MQLNYTALPATNDEYHQLYEWLLNGAEAGDPHAALMFADKIMLRAARQGNTTYHMRFLFCCCRLCDTLGHYTAMQGYARQAYALEPELTEHRDCAYFYTMLGAYECTQNNVTLMFAHLQKALELHNKGNTDIQDHMQTLYTLGKYYTETGAFDTALKYNLRCLEHAMTNNIRDNMITSHHLIGALYLQLEDYERAEHHMLLALRYSSYPLVTGIVTHLLRELCQLYNATSRHADSLPLLEEALANNKRLGNKSGQAYTMMYISGTLLKLGKYTEALDMGFAALDMVPDDSNICIRVAILHNIGAVYLQTNEIQHALTYLNNAFSIWSESCRFMDTITLHKTLAHANERAGDFQTALYHQRQYQQLREQTLSNEVLSRIANEQQSPELRELMLKNDKLHQELSIHQKRYESQKAILLDLTLTVVEREEALRSFITMVKQRARTGSGSVKKFAAMILQRVTAHTGGQLREKSIHTVFCLVFQPQLAKLAGITNTLTASECKICVFIMLNFAIKDIASLLHLSSETVRSHRKNIRKKLQLSAGDNLSTHLQNL